MTKTERINQIIPKLEAWAFHVKRVNAIYTAMEAVTGSIPDAPIWEAVWGMENAYTDAVSDLVGDEFEWLSYYHLVCEMGKKPREVKLPSGKTITIKTLRDLARVICET